MKSILINCILHSKNDLPARILIKDNRVCIAINTNICASHEMILEEFFTNEEYDFVLEHNGKLFTRADLRANIGRCIVCGDIIESKYRHDYCVCKCDAAFVDGGNDYWRTGGSIQRLYKIRDLTPGTYFDGAMIVT